MQVRKLKVVSAKEYTPVRRFYAHVGFFSLFAVMVALVVSMVRG